MIQLGGCWLPSSTGLMVFFCTSWFGLTHRPSPPSTQYPINQPPSLTFIEVVIPNRIQRTRFDNWGSATLYTASRLEGDMVDKALCGVRAANISAGAQQNTQDSEHIVVDRLLYRPDPLDCCCGASTTINNLLVSVDDACFTTTLVWLCRQRASLKASIHIVLGPRRLRPAWPHQCEECAVVASF